MKALNLLQTYKNFYTAKAQPSGIIVPKLRYLSANGHGDPNTSEQFKSAVEALFSVSYTLKFTVKKTQQIDYKVMPLEGLWWCKNMDDFSVANKSNWDWTLLILQPDFITEAKVEEAKLAVSKKKANDYLSKLRLLDIEEGRAVQILHIGPFATEAEDIQKIHHHIQEINGTFDGLKQKHHEIYLSDMRKTAPEKLKTIIRQPYIAN